MDGDGLQPEQHGHDRSIERQNRENSSLSLSLPTPTSWIPDYPSPAPPPRHRQRPPGVVLPERPCARLVTGVEGSGQA